MNECWGVHTFLVVAMQSAHNAAKETFVQYLQQLQRSGMHLHPRAARHQQSHGYNGCIVVTRIFPA